MKRVILGLSMLGLSACGKDESIHSVGSGQSADQEKAEGKAQDRDEKQMPPKGYYDALFEAQLRLVDQGKTAPTGPQVLWINFEGASVGKGFGPGQSFILCRQSATIPAAGLSPADEEIVLTGVQKFFDDAGAQLVITNAEPASGDYTTMHVGGAYADIGCIGPGVLGVAPFDVGNANRNDVGFAFTKNVSASVIAETIAHEAGHSFGLDHVTNRKDLMFASSTNEIEGFAASAIAGSKKLQDGPAILRQVLGAGNATQQPGTPSQPQSPAQPQPPVAGIPNLPGSLAGLPGLDQIANIGKLLPGLQPGAILDITQLLPQIQSLIPIASTGVALPGLDKIFTVIGVAGAAQGNNGQAPTAPAAGSKIASVLDPAKASQILSSPAVGTIATLASLAGYGDVTQYVQIAQVVLDGAAQVQANKQQITAANPALTSVPNLATLLGLAQANPDVATLIQSLSGSAQVVNGNFTGANKEALLSLLKLAYTQQYLDLIQNAAP